MKILSSEQVRAWDKYTIDNEPISSIDLIERAALAFTYWFTNIYDSDKNILVFMEQVIMAATAWLSLVCCTSDFSTCRFLFVKFLKMKQKILKKILKYCLIVPKYCPKGMPSASGIRDIRPRAYDTTTPTG